jgi:hypothetical protein
MIICPMYVELLINPALADKHTRNAICVVDRFGITDAYEKVAKIWEEASSGWARRGTSTYYTIRYSSVVYAHESPSW